MSSSVGNMDVSKKSENRLMLLPNSTEDDAEIPDLIILKIFGYLNTEEIKQCRLVCKIWNIFTLCSEVLPQISCFIHDGRQSNLTGSPHQIIFQQHELGLTVWNHMRIRRTHIKQLSFINHELTKTISLLELKNCSLSWTSIIFLLTEFDNLTTFFDIQDMYCWDYSTFSEGLDNEEDLDENPSFKALEQDRLVVLQNLRHVKIHRSQFTDCATYLKMLNLKCDRLESLSVTTDQSLNPRPSERFYSSLGTLIQKNSGTLETLTFPYRHITPVFEFRITDDNHPFRDFLNYAADHDWGEIIRPQALTELNIQFPIITIDEILFRQKLLPFLESWESLKKVFLNCVLLAVGKEHILMECIPSHITPEFGIWMNDNGINGLIPRIDNLKSNFSKMTIQTWRPTWMQVRDVIVLPDLEDGTIEFKHITNFQYFNKSPNFKNFNMNLMTKHFPNLTHLNLVDHNTRSERLHSSEALATVEDDDMQLIINRLKHLVFLQINGNMTFLTDSGLTGLKASACKRMRTTSSWISKEDDIIGKPFSSLRCLRHIVLRGVGIKVSDVSVYKGFMNLSIRFKKLLVFGAHQVTPNARVALAEKFPPQKGYDIQI